MNLTLDFILSTSRLEKRNKHIKNTHIWLVYICVYVCIYNDFMLIYVHLYFSTI